MLNNLSKTVGSKNYIYKNGVLDVNILGQLVTSGNVSVESNGIKMTALNNTSSISFSENLDLSKKNIFFKFDVIEVLSPYHYLSLYCGSEQVFYKEQAMPPTFTVANGYIVTPIKNVNTGIIKLEISTNETSRKLVMLITQIWVEEG